LHKELPNNSKYEHKIVTQVLIYVAELKMIPADDQNLPICEIEVTPEWLTPESIQYVAECINYCENSQMLAELRHIFPRQVLTEASRYVKGPQRQNLRLWLRELNN
jgi:hypothetical protein